MTAADGTLAERAGFAGGERDRRAAEVVRRAEADGIGVVRLVWADQHGVTRGKTVVAADLLRALRDGVAVTTTLLLKDTAHRTAWPVFSAGAGMGMAEMQGAADFWLLPDPATFRVLPWAPHTGWVLCDGVFADGRAVPDLRGVLRRAVARAAGMGFGFVTGVELEFHLFRLVDPHLAPEDAGQPGTPPEVSLLTQGYNYLTEWRYDALDPVLEVLRAAVQGLGLPLRSLEVEYGPSQVEFTFEAREATESADNVVLFRNAVKQVARRHGYHATFMCRPRIPNVMSSGWHLHQSLTRDGRNAFAGEGGTVLSATARQYLGGLLRHARAGAAFSTPTLNGYRRYRPLSLAPDRAVWGMDNRGVMVRALGRPGDPATRLENRVGEPAANPYLYMASQLHFGLDGIARGIDPGPPVDAPYEHAAETLPRSLGEALAALEASDVAREAIGGDVVDWFLRIKRQEIARFEAEVSEWEQREYFDLL
ncbi:glutamine synthetase family protein [Roseomonas sp. CCTCC AB2023176]|uniref:glutamine synthetase family protein n=1 Tax=Roseomonas sp. CCTCC AB2023176 TaxID=3342640 RepID=UPI0035E07572